MLPFLKWIHFLIPCIAFKNETSLSSGGLRPPDLLCGRVIASKWQGRYPPPPKKNHDDATDNSCYFHYVVLGVKIFIEYFPLSSSKTLPKTKILQMGYALILTGENIYHEKDSLALQGVRGQQSAMVAV